MRFIIKNNSGENIENLMRSLRYHIWDASNEDRKISFIRPLEGGGAYPRFHIYLQYNKITKEIAFDLHLDQRRTVYEGAKAHKGEYEGEVVEEEAQRIRNILNLKS